MFSDRKDAGQKLLERLPRVDPAETVVVALPRGGVPVADVIATALEVPLDIVFVRKVGVPGQKEVALAAVTNGDDPVLTVNEGVARAVGLNRQDIWKLAEPELAEIARRRKTYLGDLASVPVKGKTVIVVDDGIATGATARASLRSLRAKNPAKLILAVPVAPREVLDDLAGEVDEIVCLEVPRPFFAVGAHYRDFAQVSDREVIQTLADNRAAMARQTRG